MKSVGMETQSKILRLFILMFFMLRYMCVCVCVVKYFTNLKFEMLMFDLVLHCRSWESTCL